MCKSYRKWYFLQRSSGSTCMEQMPYPHIFCATCLSFVCGPQCPICRTVIEDPKVSIQPAPFVLQTIISELDFQCPTCSQIKLHKLPEHQEQGCIPLTVSPPMPTYRVILLQMYRIQPLKCQPKCHHHNYQTHQHKFNYQHLLRPTLYQHLLLPMGN